MGGIVKRALAGKIALVTGATRGAGRGIAVQLGAAGATVYVTGRSTRAARSPMDRPETIEDTADLVSEAGGRGIAVQVDHLDQAQVRALADRLAHDDGRLDILVNDVWGGDPLARWGVAFWEHPLEDGLRLLRTAVETHVIASWHLLPLLIARPGGLVVEVTDGTADADYRGSMFYDLAKASVIRFAQAQAAEVRPHGGTAVAITPGFLRSEAMLDHFGVTEATWRAATTKDPHFIASETPTYVGRAVAALAADPRLARWSGKSLSSWQLAREYGFTDADGTRPDWGAYFDAVVVGGAEPADPSELSTVPPQGGRPVQP